MIFFDIDDTLIDFKYAEYLGVKTFYQQYKKSFEMDEELFYENWSEIAQQHFDKYLRGEISFKQQRIERLKAIFNLSNIKLTDEEAWDMYLIYKKNFEDNWKLFDDVIPCLESILKYGLGVISNGDLTQQTRKLQRMGIYHYFKEIITAGEYGVSKPDTEIFRIASNRAEQPIHECWYIGDNYKTDILPCQEVGMKCIWLNRTQMPIIDDNVITVNNLNEVAMLIEKD